MDYAQVSNYILCNGSNTTLHLQKIPFLSVLWKLYSQTEELSTLGRYEEFQLAPGSLYLRPRRKSHLSFLSQGWCPGKILMQLLAKQMEC